MYSQCTRFERNSEYPLKNQALHITTWWEFLAKLILPYRRLDEGKVYQSPEEERSFSAMLQHPNVLSDLCNITRVNYFMWGASVNPKARRWLIEREDNSWPYWYDHWVGRFTGILAGASHTPHSAKQCDLKGRGLKSSGHENIDVSL